MSVTPPTYPGQPVSQRELPGAVGGLVLGILSLVLAAPIVGLVLAIIGFRMSRQAKLVADQAPGVYRQAGLAVAGYVCNIVGIVLGALSTFGCCAYIAVVGAVLFAASSAVSP